MADEDKKPVETPPAGEDKKIEKPAELSQAEWKKIVGDKFKDENELAKSYKSLEEEKGRLSTELGQAREFSQTVQPLLEVIRDDPELFQALDKKLREKGQPKDMTKATPEERSESTKEVRSVATDLIISRFEESKGIDKLTAEEKKVAREKMGNVIAEMTGQALTDIDLRRLSTVLENAYTLANKDQLVEKSKLEALAKARGLDEASIGSLSSSQGKVEEALTPEESRVAERMGLTREQYLTSKKKRK